MFERFTPEARNTIIGAQVQARRLGHDQILAEDVLLAAISDDQTSPGRILRECGVDPERLTAELTSLGPADADALRQIGIDLDSVRRQIERVFGAGALDQPRNHGGSWLGGRRRAGGHLPFSPVAKKSLEQALRQALALGHNFIGAEHVVLGLLATDDAPAALTLTRLGVDVADVRSRLIAELRRAA
jgi:ATP-dependent Clp protease ATP-binding subunit ClpA